MNIMYKCSFCNKIYEWYDVVYEDPKDKNSIYAKTNCLMLLHHPPVEIEKTEVTNADGNLDNLHINICQDCMHKLLDNLTIDNDNAWTMI